MDEIANTFKEHPVAIIAAVLAVAVFAYMSRGSSQGTTVTFSGGKPSSGIDPNAAAIQEAAIGAGQSGVQAIASLIATEHQADAQVQEVFAQTDAAVQAQKLSTDAAVSISQINANTEAQRIAAQKSVTQSGQQEQQNVARAGDNTSIVGSILNAGVAIVEHIL